jgi:hypothetical protein
MNTYNYSHREDLPIIISNIYEKNPNISKEEFLKKIVTLKYDFFYLNGINRKNFSIELYKILNETSKKYEDVDNKYDELYSFIENNLLIGIQEKNVENRKMIIDYFTNVKKPHEKLMILFNKVLQKIELTYQIDLHGVKEYSGIDIVKRHKGLDIGFQIKSRNDDISEDRIRSQTSKSIEQGIDVFVLVYGRKNTNKTSSSIQMAYHYFKNLYEKEKKLCYIISPEIFAELLILHKINGK